VRRLLSCRGYVVVPGEQASILPINTITIVLLGVRLAGQNLLFLTNIVMACLRSIVLYVFGIYAKSNFDVRRSFRVM
jgi:hypothetical protein